MSVDDAVRKRYESMYTSTLVFEDVFVDDLPILKDVLILYGNEMNVRL